MSFIKKYLNIVLPIVIMAGVGYGFSFLANYLKSKNFDNFCIGCTAIAVGGIMSLLSYLAVKKIFKLESSAEIPRFLLTIFLCPSAMVIFCEIFSQGSFNLLSGFITVLVSAIMSCLMMVSLSN